MPMNNPFDTPAFHVTALTAAINILPNSYGRLERMMLMPPRPVRFRQIAVEEKNGVLNLLPTLPIGSPGTVGERGKRKLRSFNIPHIPHDDVVLPEEVQGIRAFGSENESQALADVMADHLQSMRNKHAITLEHLRMGALKGVILDADGSALYDLYAEFGIEAKTVAFGLGNANTNVKNRCISVLRHIEDNLRGEFMTRVHALVSPEFFDALTSHAKVEKAYERWMEGRGAARRFARGLHLRRHHLRGVPRPGDGPGRRGAPVHRRERGPRLPARHRRDLRVLLRAGRLQRDRQHPGTAALRQAGAAQVRTRHRSPYPVQPAAHVPPPGRAGEADGRVR